MEDIPVRATKTLPVKSEDNRNLITWKITDFLDQERIIQSEFYRIQYFTIQFVINFPDDQGKGDLQISLYQFPQTYCGRISFKIKNLDKSRDVVFDAICAITPDYNKMHVTIPLSYNSITEENGFLDNNTLTMLICVPFKSHDLVRNPIKYMKIKEHRRMSNDMVTVPRNNNFNFPDDKKPARTIEIPSTKSKEETGYVGLKNQGATCYMNSMLQAFFHVPAFRKIVFSIPTTGKEDTEKSILLNLQRLFCRLQTSTIPCQTKDLTTSFGWSSRDAFYQHDIQEFCRVVLENLESKMQGTPLQDSISSLFRGKYNSYIRCLHVPYESTCCEKFYDLQLVVKGISSLEESFDAYTAHDKLVGDNQYDAESFGKQDAIMGTEFKEFPSILHLHLSRFEFDLAKFRNYKLNDYFSFPETIDLTKYIAMNVEATKSNVFDLYGVLVHSGGVSGGHYFAFLRTSTKHDWYKFNDSLVTKVTKEQAIDDNFGGNMPNSNSPKSYSAYMLIYIRREDVNDIFAPVSDDMIPQHIIDYVQHALEEEQAKIGEQITKIHSVPLTIVPDSVVEQNVMLGINGFKPQNQIEPINVNKEMKMDEVYNVVAKHVNLPGDKIRIFLSTMDPLHYLPTSFIRPSDSIVSDVCSQENNVLFVQKLDEGENLILDQNQMKLYLKFYFPEEEAPIQYIGTIIIDKTKPVSSIFDEVCSRVGMEKNNLIAFRETWKSVPIKLESTESFQTYSKDLQNEPILILQCDTAIKASYSYNFKPSIPPPQPEDFFISLDEVFPDEIKKETVDQYFTVTTKILFIQLYSYTEPTEKLLLIKFPGRLSFKLLKMFIANITNLDYNPEKNSLLLYTMKLDKTPNSEPLNTADTRLPCNFLHPLSGDSSNIINLFIHLDETISENSLHQSSKYTIQVSFDGYTVGLEKEFYHPTNSACKELLYAIKDEILISDSLNLRFSEVYQSRYYTQYASDAIYKHARYPLRIDIIPQDQSELDDGEFLVQVLHGYNENFTLKAKENPFFLKVKKGEQMKYTKKRIAKLIKNNESEINDSQFKLVPNGIQGDSAIILNDDDELFTKANKDSLLYMISKKDLVNIQINVGTSQPRKEVAIKIYN